MAGLGLRFDATEYDTEQRDYAELPNGIYRFEITESDVVPTKNGTGTVLKVTNDVIEPAEYKGRKLFGNFNLENANAQAQEIGRRQLASMYRAIGVTEVNNSEELHFKSYLAKVGLGKPSKDGQYPARAEIKRYYFPDDGDLPEPAIDAAAPKPANDNRAAANDNRAAAAAPAAKAAGGRPWKK